jgi:hypothetical protein
VLVYFLLLQKISDINELKRGKDYFGSWPSMWYRMLLTPATRKQKERGRARAPTLLQGHGLKDLTSFH